MRQILIVIIMAAAVLSSGCGNETSSNNSNSDDYGKATVTINGLQFETEVPLKDKGFMLGLMYRERLEDSKGMLFAYPDSGTRNFWMKNTLIPLDMLFIDENGTIKKIHRAIPCKSDPCPLYSSTVPVKYVLEIKGGLTNEEGIMEGDKAEIRFLDGPTSS